MVLTSAEGVRIIVEVKYSNGKGMGYGFDVARAGNWLAVELDVCPVEGRRNPVARLLQAWDVAGRFESSHLAKPWDTELDGMDALHSDMAQI